MAAKSAKEDGEEGGEKEYKKKEKKKLSSQSPPGAANINCVDKLSSQTHESYISFPLQTKGGGKAGCLQEVRPTFISTLDHKPGIKGGGRKWSECRPSRPI